MLTPFDDYPIHQTPLPVAHPVSGDRNFYDRYFFNGYDPDGEWFIGCTMGVYPNRDVIDASFSVLRDGVQRSVFASARLPADRATTSVGPFTLEVVSPLKTTRLHVAAEHLGIEADLTWDARTMALEEPRQTLVAGPAAIMDATRLVQWGTWHGSVAVEGSRFDVDRSRARGTKDRSWGIRPIGEPPGGAPPVSGGPVGVFFLWAPIHFQDRCTHAILFERADGERWYWSGGEVPLLGEGEQPWGSESSVRRPRGVEYHLDMKPGTRRSRGATFEYDYRDGGKELLEFTPIMDFQMKGLGYLNLEWGHGTWHGETAEGSQSWKVDELDPLAWDNVHVEQLCRVRSGDREGVGVLEQLTIGPHAPTGLKGYDDGAPG
jgi:hypothetical protein